MGNVTHDPSRRRFIKKMAYVPPAVLTLTAVPSYATTGSQRSGNGDDDSQEEGGGGNHYISSVHHRRHRRGSFKRFLAIFGLG